MLRGAVIGLLLVSLALLEAVVAPAVAVFGVVPDLTVLAVAGLALGAGPAAGTRVGFAAGLLRDLLGPPGALLGPWTLALLGVGFAVGAVRPYLAAEGLPTQVGVGAVAAAAAALCAELLAAALGQPTGRLADIALRSVLNAGWGVLLAPLVLRPTRALATQTTPVGAP